MFPQRFDQIFNCFINISTTMKVKLIGVKCEEMKC